MKVVNKFRRNQLILGLIFMAIGILGAWGIVEIAYSSYQYIPMTYSGDQETISSEPELFGPKKPTKYESREWDYQFRFLYNPYKETVNC